MQRDNYTCQGCGISPKWGKGLTAHHIKPRKTYPQLRCDVDNLIIYCRECHPLEIHYCPHEEYNWVDQSKSTAKCKECGNMFNVKKNQRKQSGLTLATKSTRD